MIRYVEVNTSFQGFHRYPGADNDVNYLKYTHRHMFYVKARLEVFHNDREVEFIGLKNKLNTFLKNHELANINSNSTLSCENLCEDLCEFLRSNYSVDRKIHVEVFEDNENGSIIELDKYEGI